MENIISLNKSNIDQEHICCAISDKKCKDSYELKKDLFLTLILFSNGLFAQYTGSVPPISSGYGADGAHSVSVTTISNDHYFSHDISVFYPQGTTTPIPTIFFSHGYGASDTTFNIETLYHIASKGYVVVFVPYKTFGVTIPERYTTLFDGFTKAARNLTSIIDTTRIGFYGHSFGGGATLRISYREFTENNWGANCKFIFCSAPWYSYELGTSTLSNFPTDCKMLTVVYENDSINDHRMGMDIFNNIAIDDSIKDCLIVYSDTILGYTYQADHNLAGQYSPKGEFDALDYYTTFRLLDALAEYTFTGNLTAKDVALGNGSPAQIYMGGQLNPLFHTNYPTPIYAQSQYEFPCDTLINERQAFCQIVLGINESVKSNTLIEIYPNPTKGKLNFNSLPINHQFIISIFTITGEKIITKYDSKEIDISTLEAGIYIISINIDGITETKQIIKIE